MLPQHKCHERFTALDLDLGYKPSLATVLEQFVVWAVCGIARWGKRSSYV